MLSTKFGIALASSSCRCVLKQTDGSRKVKLVRADSSGHPVQLFKNRFSGGIHTLRPPCLFKTHKLFVICLIVLLFQTLLNTIKIHAKFKGLRMANSVQNGGELLA